MSEAAKPLIAKCDHIISTGKVRFHWTPLIANAITSFPVDDRKPFCSLIAPDRRRSQGAITTFPLETHRAIEDPSIMYNYIYVYICTFTLLIAKKGAQAGKKFVSRAFFFLRSLPGLAIRKIHPSYRDCRTAPIRRCARNLPDRTPRSGAISAITTFPLEQTFAGRGSA